MREADLEVVFYRPEMAEAYFFRAHHLIHHVMESLVLALTVFQRAVDLDLVENSEVHCSSSVTVFSLRKRIARSGEAPDTAHRTVRRFGGICIVLAAVRARAGSS